MEIPAGAKGTLSPEVYLKQTMPAQSPVYPTGEVYTYRNSEMALVAFTTDEDKAAALIPEQLQLVKIPLPGQASVFAIFAKYRENDQIGPYMEVIVAIPVLHKGQLWLYVPYIYVDSDSAMTAGREYGGYPKKFARIEMRAFGSLWLGTMSRGTMHEKTTNPNFNDIFSMSLRKGGRLFSMPLSADKSPQLPFPYNLILPMPKPAGEPQPYVLPTMGLRRVQGVGPGPKGAYGAEIAQLVTSPWIISPGAFYAASDVSLEFYPSKEDPIAQALPINAVLAGVILQAELMTTTATDWTVAEDLLKTKAVAARDRDETVAA